MSQISRKKSRKYLFQKLFSESYTSNNNELFIESFLIDNFKWNLDMEYIEKMEKLIIENEWFLIFIISKYANKFDIKNMSITYIFPIFIWATEMLFLEEEIPAKVSINEAIEISKSYWEENANKIVNWVLAHIYDNINDIKKEKISFNNNIDFSFFKNR